MSASFLPFADPELGLDPPAGDRHRITENPEEDSEEYVDLSL
jgi:hypothetical protein